MVSAVFVQTVLGTVRMWDLNLPGLEKMNPKEKNYAIVTLPGLGEFDVV